jgi:hypothetical protein
MLTDEDWGRAHRERRFRILVISAECLPGLIEGRVHAVGDWTPGARFVGADYNMARLAFDVALMHPSFDPVPDGREPPRFIVEVEECRA